MSPTLYNYRRHRAMQSGASPYVVLMDTIKIQPTAMQVQIVNTVSKVPLLLQVTALKDNTARLKISDIDSIRPRYEIPVGDSLVGEPKTQE